MVQTPKSTPRSDDKTHEYDQPLWWDINDCRYLTGYEKRVLTVFARWGNPDGSRCWVSLTTVEREADISNKTVHQVMQSLRDIGILVPVEIRPGRTNHYRIDRARILEVMHVDKKTRKVKKEPRKVKLVEEKQPVVQHKYTLTREEIHAKIEAALHAKK